MKKLKDILSLLPEPIRTKAINNLEDPEERASSSDLENVLIQAFVWSESKEGHEYWNDIHQQLENGVEPKDLKEHGQGDGGHKDLPVAAVGPGPSVRAKSLSDMMRNDQESGLYANPLLSDDGIIRIIHALGPMASILEKSKHVRAFYEAKIASGELMVVKTANVVLMEGSGTMGHCNSCGIATLRQHSFCPGCGAKIVKE